MESSNFQNFNMHDLNHVAFRTAAENVAEEARRERFSTGSKNLDDLLSGGIELGSITQIYGASDAGKTHFCHSLCVVLPLQFKSIYIDTEGGFSGTRIKSIAQARGLDYEKILDNINIAKANSTKEHESYIETSQSMINSDPAIKLLIIDSMMNLYRLEYPDRSILSKRQARISKYMYLLSKIAENSGVAVVITNQVQSNPNPYSVADKLIPIGGNAIAYPSRYIINLELMGSTYRNAVLKKSPLKAPASKPVMIYEGGFVDQGPNYLALNDI